MSKNFSLLAILLLVSSSLFAQSFLKGKVTDQSGQPISGTSVMILQNQSGTITQADGSYQIELPGKLKNLDVEFRFLGFKSRLRSINVSEGDNVLDVSLDESPIELQDVTVTAGFFKEKELLPYPIITMDKEELVSSGVFNISQAIARNPGIQFSSLGNAISKPVIRGLSNANIIMLNNGAKLENFNYVSNQPFLVDEFTADRIEVIKGPSSLQYGSDAVGGVVNVVRERPAQPQSISGDLISQYNTNSNGYTNSLGIKGSGKTFFGGVRGSMKSHEDFTDGNGDVVINTRLNESNLSANMGARTNIGIFSINYNYTEANYGTQTRSTIKLFNNADAAPLLEGGRENQVWFQDLENHQISSNNTLFLGENTLEIDIAYQANNRQGVRGALKQGELSIPTKVDMQLNTFSFNTKYAIKKDKRRLVFGINGANIQNDANEEKPSNSLRDSKINDVGLYAIGDFTLSEKLTLTSGLRYDFRNMESFPDPRQRTYDFVVDKTFNVVNGSAGITYRLDETQFLKANVSKGFRSPTMPELTQKGLFRRNYTLGDPSLKPQENYQFDLNYSLSRNWITFDISPYYNIISNYIYLIETTEPSPDGGGNIFRYVQNDVNFYGGELALNLRPFKWLGVNGNYSIVRADVTNSAEGIKHPTLIPQDRIMGELRFEQEKLGFFKRPYLAVELMHFVEQNRTGQNETSSPAYTLFNVRLGTNIAVA